MTVYDETLTVIIMILFQLPTLAPTGNQGDQRGSLHKHLTASLILKYLD